MTKQKPSQRKALRSAAAKKGWETRRAKGNGSSFPSGADWFRLVPYIPPYVQPETFVRLTFDVSPDPTPAPPNWLHRLWAKITGTA